MSEEDRKLQKHLVYEMMKVSKTNPDVMFYMESLMKKYEELEQKVEQLENIRKEAIEWIDKHDYYSGSSDIYYFNDFTPSNDLLNILNKGSDKK